MREAVHRKSRVWLLVVLALALLVSLGAVSPSLAQDNESLTISLYDVQTRMVGTATFTQMEQGVQIEMTVNGMEPTPGDRSVMIHEVGVCQPPDYLQSVGPVVTVLPPAQFYINGGTEYKILTNEFTLAELMDADGSSLDIHADVPPNAGPIIICGAIPTGTGAPPPAAPTAPPAAPTTPPAAPTAPPAAPTAPPAAPPAPQPSTPPPVAGACPVELREALERGAGAFLIDVNNRLVGLTIAFEAPDCVVILSLAIEGMQPVAGDHHTAITQQGACVAPTFASAGAERFALPDVPFTGEGTAEGGIITNQFRVADLLDADGSALVLHAGSSASPGERIICGSLIPLPELLAQVGLTVDDILEATEG
jgi:Cu/Zn superoxide dismutase